CSSSRARRSLIIAPVCPTTRYWADGSARAALATVPPAHGRVILECAVRHNREGSMARPRVVLVTGATSGLGRELARTLSAAPGRLLVHGRSQDKLDALQEELSGATAQ